jgi:hypothetical protein
MGTTVRVKARWELRVIVVLCHLSSIIMAREIRMRVSEKEYSLLETVRNTSDRFDSSIPLGHIVGELARKELSETLSEEIEVPA